MPETVPQTAVVLKSYFQTGQFPTQDQFAEFIDTMFYYYQQATDAAAAAATSAAAAAAAAAANPAVSCLITFNTATGAPALVAGSKNVASVVANGTSFALGTITFFNYTINFTTPLANINYKTIPQTGYIDQSDTHTGRAFAATQNVGSVIMAIPKNGGLYTPILSLVIFP